jgi:hypothetical protein
MVGRVNFHPCPGRLPDAKNHLQKTKTSPGKAPKPSFFAEKIHVLFTKALHHEY